MLLASGLRLQAPLPAHHCLARCDRRVQNRIGSDLCRGAADDARAIGRLQHVAGITQEVAASSARPLRNISVIAAIYTPITAQMKLEMTTVGLLVAVSLIAIAGIVLKLLRPGRLAIALYLLLGWSGVVAYEGFAALPRTGLVIAVGGMLYSAASSSIFGKVFASRMGSGMASC
jgi:hypothetical protein